MQNEGGGYVYKFFVSNLNCEKKPNEEFASQISFYWKNDNDDDVY